MSVQTLTVTNGGAGYPPNAAIPVTFSGGTLLLGDKSAATALTDSGGRVTAIVLLKPGRYNVGGAGVLPTAITIAGGTTPATVSATWTVAAVALANQGAGVYSTTPRITFACVASGCQTAAAVTNLRLGVKSVKLISAGAGYTDIPTFAIDPSPRGAGSTATIAAVAATGFSATQVNGVITADAPNTLLVGGTGIFTPTGALNDDHVGFYGTTLANFVQTPFDMAAAASHFGSIAPSLLRLRPEIVLTNPNAAVNGGNVTVASNWNLGAGTVDGGGKVTLTYRTLAAGEPGVLTLRALNDVQVRATISDGFFATDSGGNLVPNLPANQIDNNPTINAPNTTAAAAVMPMFGTAFPYRDSFSYRITAGAALAGDATTAAATDPAAVVLSASTSQGNVTIDGHTSYDNTTRATLAIFIPTLIRTGTGSITIAAANDVAFIDAQAPGAIYTAGTVAALPPNFTPPPASPLYASSPNGLVSTPTWTSGGGSVAIAAGRSIIGIETPVDPSGMLTGSTNGMSGQFWSAWYMHAGLSNGGSTPFDGAGTSQTAAWVNFASFFQGVGALGGGDIRLRAGRDITDISASLPETIAVSGGIMGTDANGRPTPIPAQLNAYGGGNLSVEAGGDLNSGAFLVGRGVGAIRVTGAVQVTASNPVTGLRTAAPTTFNGIQASGLKDIPLLLAVQDGFIDLTASGSVMLGGVYDPAALPSSLLRSTPLQYQPGAAADGSNSLWGSIFTSYGVTLPGGPSGASGVSLTSIAGDITANTLLPGEAASVMSGAASQVLPMLMPPMVRLAAFSGNVAIQRDMKLAPSVTGTLDILAARSVDLSGVANQAPILSMVDVNARPDLLVGPVRGSLGQDDLQNNYISPLGSPLAALTVPLHAGDQQPVRIAAGQDVVGNSAFPSIVQLLKPAQIAAGRDITNLAFVGENNAAEDVTAISAGRDLVGGQYTIYGPGSLLMSAGRDIGPFLPSGAETRTAGTVNTINGVIAVGNFANGAVVGAASINQTKSGNLTIKPYLPAKSADITLLYGISKGIDYQGAISRFVDPASAGTDGIDFLTLMQPLLQRIYDGRASAGATPNPYVGRAEAYRFFTTLSTTQQNLLLDRAFLDFLAEVARDYRNPSSKYVGQYARAYEAISTLFPASLGYTGSRDVANLPSGKLNLSSAVLQTQQNGDINILGPGGGVIVGSNARDVLLPNQQGILTLAKGTIRLYADGDVALGQSRIMTEQGGDIVVFSGNGDINAGSGPKTYVSNSPLSQICDANGFCAVNPAGLVSGAGIAALLTLPGQDPHASNVILAAPRGVIDFGAAGIRAGGDVVLVATQILNAYNVQAGGTISGLPTATLPNVGALTTASNVAGAASKPETPMQGPSRDAASVIVVEVLGYGGSPSDDDDRRKRDDQPQP